MDGVVYCVSTPREKQPTYLLSSITISFGPANFYPDDGIFPMLYRCYIQQCALKRKIRAQNLVLPPSLAIPTLSKQPNIQDLLKDSISQIYRHTLCSLPLSAIIWRRRHPDSAGYLENWFVFFNMVSHEIGGRIQCTLEIHTHLTLTRFLFISSDQSTKSPRGPTSNMDAQYTYCDRAEEVVGLTRAIHTPNIDKDEQKRQTNNRWKNTKGERRRKKKQKNKEEQRSRCSTLCQHT